MNSVCDFEQELLALDMTKDIQILMEDILDRGLTDQEDISNRLLGIMSIFGARMDRAFETFSKLSQEIYTLRNENKKLQDQSELSKTTEDFEDTFGF